MTKLLLYFLEVSALLTLLYGCYYLLLKKETFFSFNRFFLIAILMISLVLPMISFDLPVSNKNLLEEQVKDLGNARYVYHLAFDNWSNQIADDSFSKESWYQKIWSAKWQGISISLLVCMIIYLSGLIFFLRRLFRAYRKVFRLSQTVQSENWQGIKVARIPASMAPFSFLNTAFIPEGIEDQHEYAQILAHEKTHVRQKHSIDLILVQLLAAFLWFNPVVWLLVKSLKQTHEYIADKNMLIQGFSLVAYQALLLRQLISNNSYGLVHHFNFSFIKKRITMMSIKKSGWAGKSRATVALSLILILGMMTAQSNTLMNVDSFNLRNTSTDDKTEMKFFIDGVALKDGLKFSEVKNSRGQFEFKINNNQTDRIEVGLELIRKGRKVAHVGGNLQETETLKIQTLLSLAELEDYIIVDIINGPSEVVKLYKFPLFRESDGWKMNSGSDLPPPPVKLFVDGTEVSKQNGIAFEQLKGKNFDVELEYVLSEFVDYDVLKSQGGDVTTNLVRGGRGIKSIVTTGVKRKDNIPLKDLLESAQEGDAVVIQIGDPDGLQIAWMFMLESK